MSETIPANGRAKRTKSTFQMEYTVAINIQAQPSRLWKLLTTAEEFPRWNSTVQSIEGKIAAGQTVKLKATIAPNRTFNLTISEFVPETRMVWRDGNFMFSGVRTYTLTPQGNGSTNFHMSELYSGLMLPMIAGSLPDFVPTFEQYAADLKKAAEK